MKMSDFILRYPTNRFGTTDSLCRVRVFCTQTLEVVALLTDIGEKNPGRSVTNSVEWARKALIERGLVPYAASFIEHYDGTPEGWPEFSHVTFNSDNEPDWDHLSRDSVAGLLECDPTELDESTSDNPRLLEDVERVLHSMGPFVDSPYPEAPAVIARKMEIEEMRISKATLADLINAGATERELQAQLRRDPSILGEMYARPRDEYIVFSEFPVADGFADFALFTGRSRMDIVLIEVKGANFRFATRNSYKNLSTKVNEAAQQIRHRMGEVYRRYDTFRTAVHKIRRRVEAGESLYSSFLGPYSRLEVDPRKDISMHCVVIAGRTHNDAHESRLRHEFEWSTTPPVRLESWDSWLRKLDRI